MLSGKTVNDSKDVLPVHIQPGAQDHHAIAFSLCLHGLQAMHTRTPEQSEKNRLGLILAVMGQQQDITFGRLHHVSQSGVARMASCAFDTITQAEVHADPLLRDGDIKQPPQLTD